MHTYDHHQNVTETILIYCLWWDFIQATECDTKSINMHLYNSGAVSQATVWWIVQQVHHTRSIWMCCTLAANHMLCRTHAGHDVAYTKMTWTDEALSLSFLTCASPHTWVTLTQEPWDRQQYTLKR